MAPRVSPARQSPEARLRLRPRRRRDPRRRAPPGSHRARTASSAAIATASWSRSGSRVVSSWSFKPGPHHRPHPRLLLRLRPANLISSKEMPAITGTPSIARGHRASTTRAARGARTRRSRRSSPPAGSSCRNARMQTREALRICGREREPCLVAGDRLVLGAVILEHPAQVAHPREQQPCSRGKDRGADSLPPSIQKRTEEPS